ncbi:hypothetical protein [Actinoplanes siamensis]|uniref:Uncharacterized protein n=1 Tax=Actinoplanes siamensis TaxID=1223317 RepID=A0A919TMB9_9ACTN|nr:hypothetical protein [Actinoplanes siamensis]GIF07389.1 hypothetical protein Asi03nite_49270 [Actinoplanes siamensis]
MPSTHLRRAAVVVAMAFLIAACGDATGDDNDDIPPGPGLSPPACPPGPMPSGLVPTAGAASGMGPGGPPGPGGPGCGPPPPGVGGGGGAGVDRLTPDEEPSALLPRGTDLRGAARGE